MRDNLWIEPPLPYGDPIRQNVKGVRDAQDVPNEGGGEKRLAYETEP